MSNAEESNRLAENRDGMNNYDQLSEMYQQQTKKLVGGSDNNGQQQQHQQQELPIDANYPNLQNNQYHRRFRASRNFKNPPQPHMCIREKTIDGQELFINVLSWNRIADPTDKNSPIPLFGGMKVLPGSARSPPLVYAVMASPEVLKQSGRKCPDSPERMNLVDLMCEFVEEMNPGLVLSRHPEILKDRDLSGELKDVWNAVQALRDKQRAENHYATQENLVLYTEFGPESAPPMYQQQPQQQQQQRETVIQYSGQSAITTTTNDDAASIKDHMEKISSETENMRISPTESPTNQKCDDEPTTLPTTNNPIVASPTSVIVSTGVVNGSPTNNPTTKKDPSSSSFLTKFRSSKTTSSAADQVDSPADATNNKKDNNAENNGDATTHHTTTSQSKHKKFLSYIRRKAGTKNDNYANRDSNNKKNGDTTTTTTHNGNNEESTTTEIE
ncbi:probable serine/threonine-protein kinase dyrk1 isoform X2 [Culicoides brevitarsis]|uniref:probable serine/threonine-protein kinase dyrk1 isoform X2 n=1 Tax=Culicoides brevitarsis TaxID=469753 RepID=UPI00307B5C9F